MKTSRAGRDDRVCAPRLRSRPSFRNPASARGRTFVWRKWVRGLCSPLTVGRSTACPPLAEREAGDASVTRHSLLVGVIAAAVTSRQLSLSDIYTRPNYVNDTPEAFFL